MTGSEETGGIVRLPDAGALADAAAERLLTRAEAAVERSGRFVLVLSGGSTPQALYRRLTQPPYDTRVPWAQTTVLFGDERCVPADDPESNYRMARENLLEHVPIPGKQVHRMETEYEPVEAATRYLLKVRDLFIGEVAARFDLVLLGVGEDGHTASLFPGTAALQETRRWVAANHVPQKDTWRLTMTIPALCGAREVLFLVTGEGKARVVAEAFGGAPHDEPHPCERIVPTDGTRTVLVDEAAASRL